MTFVQQARQLSRIQDPSPSKPASSFPITAQKLTDFSYRRDVRVYGNSSPSDKTSLMYFYSFLQNQNEVSVLDSKEGFFVHMDEDPRLNLEEAQRAVGKAKQELRNFYTDRSIPVSFQERILPADQDEPVEEYAFNETETANLFLMLALRHRWGLGEPVQFMYYDGIATDLRNEYLAKKAKNTSSP